MKTLTIIALTAALFGAVTPASAAGKAGQTFMKEAIQGNLAEVQMGKLAQQKGGSDDVKQFGQKLVTDHSANLEKAKSVAQSMNMKLPTEPSAKQKAEYQKMSKLSGNQFDKQFAQHMVMDHKKDISEFQQESKKSGAAANFAKQTVPVLQQHLKIAQSLNGASTTGSSAK
jgi:putative membrane protein